MSLRTLPLVIAVAVVAGGCNLHRCEIDGTAHCEGNSAVSCYQGKQSIFGPEWHYTDCPAGSTCLEVDSITLCALGGQPRPECADAGTDVVCASDTIVSCQQGYAVKELGCTSQGKVCVVRGRCGPACFDPATVDMLPPCP